MNDANSRSSGCGHDPNSNFFDRTVCAEPCGKMHTCCRECGTVLDGCVHEQQRGQQSRTPASVWVSWLTCDCPWTTKYCDEQHRRRALVPLAVLERYADPSV